MKILLSRMMGLGDVACVGVPAARLLKRRHPEAELSYLAFRAGPEIAALAPEIDKIVAVRNEEWPDDLFAAAAAFTQLGDRIVHEGYDLFYNLDTWFMPCFLARLLKDAGARVRGNYLSRPALEVLHQAAADPESVAHYAEYPERFLASSFPNMSDWCAGPWWKTRDVSYPEFYLKHCCGFEGELNMRLEVEPDAALLAEAAGRKIVAIAASARTANRQYPHAAELRRGLEAANCLVWGGFDGSIPMRRTLGKLKVTDLLICVSSAPQWLARAVGCPSLMIPGPVPPQTLQAELNAPRQTDCQYCMADHCLKNLDYACVKVPPQTLLSQAMDYLARR